jgi:hypothetical protein
MSFKYAVLPLAAASVLLFAKPIRAELPPLFGGQLGLCANVETAVANGDSVRDAIVSNLQAVQSNDPSIRDSIKRTIIHNAIRECGYDAVAVIEGGYLAGLPVDLLAGSALAAGVDPTLVSRTLVRMGVDPGLLAEVVEEGQSPKQVELVLPPVFSIGSGLGEASPYIPAGP